MSAPYRLYGGDLSPYSVKVRSYLRYKGVPHDWLPRSRARSEEFARYAKLPLIPVLVGADESVLQDSTPMIEKLEQAHPEPSIVPADPTLAFLSALIEDYADEWLNKVMFHFRWAREEDQASAARRILDMLCDGEEMDAESRVGVEAQIRDRMTGRLNFVGSNAASGPVYESAFARTLALLEAHLATRPFLFGARPALADFGLGGQLVQLLSDPTPGGQMRAQAPAVAAYAERMLNPAAEGDFEPLDALRPTLSAFLAEDVAGRYLAFMSANAQAAARGAEEVEISGEAFAASFTQVPQRYAAKAFIELRRKRALVAAEPALAALLIETGCDAHLAPPTTPDEAMAQDNAFGSDEETSASEAQEPDTASVSASEEPPPLAGD